MSLPISQSRIVDSLSMTRTTALSLDGSRRENVQLIIETLLVTSAAIMAVRIVNSSFISKAAWFLVPAILVVAALTPAAIKNQTLAMIALEKKRVLPSIRTVFITCILLFPATLLALWLLKQLGLVLYLRPVLPQKHQWFTWLVYQFMYVAVAEELFFRGYIQRNILRLTRTLARERPNLHQWITICISAAVFAVAHIIVQGSMLSALTFLPGIVLAWLFIRTRSLLAPVLFHGLANTFYFAIAAVLT